MESSLCEKPERHASRRLSDYLTLEAQKQKVRALVDKVYARKNLHLAWERVRANRGASGTDRRGQSGSKSRTAASRAPR
jgi:hypothetical protein